MYVPIGPVIPTNRAAQGGGGRPGERLQRQDGGDRGRHVERFKGTACSAAKGKGESREGHVRIQRTAVPGRCMLEAFRGTLEECARD